MILEDFAFDNMTFQQCTAECCGEIGTFRALFFLLVGSFLFVECEI